MAIASLRTTEGASELTVVLSTGETVKARVIRTDESAQLVLLRVDAEPPAIATFADHDPRPGTRILTIGAPLGDFTSTVTAGIVGAVGITMPATESQDAVSGVFQHDAATNPGNEGGPVIDLNGLIVGIELGAVRSTTDDGIIQGWSFAIPVSRLATLLADD